MEIKIGRKVYPLKVGDYFMNNGACIMINSGDKRTFKRDRFTSYDYLTLPEKVIKQLGLRKLPNSYWQQVKIMDYAINKLVITEEIWNKLISKKEPTRKLKKWNGYVSLRGKQVHVNVAATSLARVAQLLSLTATNGTNDNVISKKSIRPYFVPVWGNTMQGFEPKEEGVWADMKVRLFPI